MKKSVIIGLVASGMFIAGCGEKVVQPQAKPISGAPSAAGASNVVVVAIGDAKLMSADLEADVARFIEANKARIPAEQLEGAKQYLTQQLKQQFITKTLLTKEAAKKGISVTDEEVKARADELIKSAKGRPGAPNSFDELLAMHPLGAERAREEFKTEALVRKFVEQEIASKITVDQEEVKSQYNQIVSNITQRAKAPTSEQVRASHILVKTDDAKNSDAAKKEIDALHAQMKDLKGEELSKKFAELAKEKSDCPSKAKGGDLGAFGHGQMVPEFDKAAFEQEIGKLYAPVKTSFGWHLILVKEKIAAKTPSAADVEKAVNEQKPKLADIERMIKNRQIQQKFQEFVQGLLEANGFGEPAARPPGPATPPKPAKSIESKPVEVKPGKPAEAAKAAAAKPVAKPAEAAKAAPAKPAPAPAKPAEAKK